MCESETSKSASGYSMFHSANGFLTLRHELLGCALPFLGELLTDRAGHNTVIEDYDEEQEEKSRDLESGE